ncbi:sigma-70 family RNA polymerase sigma factor (plasmid) [Brevibacillus laterosporus]|nr:sigma-70 family RNA polymerase sigma factor [Brevibacillus laterosporus]TPG93559.1 sigma-70 family RNA polymerase sigma factor [Brevibacillus laterosporus]
MKGTIVDINKDKEHCHKILRRIAWNLQYRVRKRNKNELLIYEDIITSVACDTEVSSIYLEEIIELIPSNKGQYIIRKIVLDGFTETELANELNMTQQGVHKCKKKYLNLLKKQTEDFLKY